MSPPLPNRLPDNAEHAKPAERLRQALNIVVTKPFSADSLNTNARGTIRKLVTGGPFVG